MRRPTHNPTASRRGILSLELAAALPVLLLVISAAVELSLLLSAQGAVADASRAAVREAALGVRGDDELLATARRALGPRLGANTQISTAADEQTGIVSVAVRVPMRSAAPNLLWPVGFDLSGRYLSACASMADEAN